MSTCAFIGFTVTSYIWGKEPPAPLLDASLNSFQLNGRDQGLIFVKIQQRFKIFYNSTPRNQKMEYVAQNSRPARIYKPQFKNRLKLYETQGLKAFRGLI